MAVRVELCEICTISSDLPEGCVSCALKQERERRLTLERQLLDLLGMARGFLNNTEAVVRSSGIQLPLLPGRTDA